MTDDDRVPVDAIKYHWLTLKDKLMREDEIIQEVGDITQIFFRGLRQKLIKGEKINIVIGNTQTRKGKSTLGLFLKYCLNQMILDLKQQTSYQNTDKDEFDLIAANQIEALRVFKRSHLRNVAVLVDEFSAMGRSGLGSTTEEHYLQWYENVAAVKRIHTIYCTPTSAYDQYGLIILEIIDIDKARKTTKAKVFYNDSGSSYKQLLGYITVNVADILTKSWNKLYLEKKNWAIDLLLKNAIRDIRELEYAIVKMIAYKKHERMAQLGNNDRNLIREKVLSASREIGGVYTVLQMDESLSNVTGLVNLIVERNKLLLELTRTNRKKPLTPDEEESIETQIETYNDEIKTNIENTKKLIKLYIDYMSIGDSSFVSSVKDILDSYSIDMEVSS